MSRFTSLQNNFLAGEIGPKLRTRTDVDEYKQGAAQVKNFLPGPSGGLIYRPGMEYLATITGPSVGMDQPYALIPFKKNDSNGDLILVLAPNHSTAANRIVAYEDPTPGGGPLSPIVVTKGSFATADLNLAPVVWGDDFLGFRFIQQGDVMFLTHVSCLMPPQIIFYKSGVIKIVRYWDGDSAIPGSTGAQFLKVPFAPRNLTATTITPSASTGTITLTASAALFTSGDVDKWIRLTVGAVTGVARITVFTSSTVVTAVVQSSCSVAASSNWEFSQWGGNYGYPKDVTYFEQRLIWAFSSGFTTTLWNSEIGNAFLLMQEMLAQDLTTSDVSGNNYFGSSKDDNDPFSYEPSGMNYGLWITGARTLHIGSDEQEFFADGSGGKYGFRNITIKAQTSIGSGKARPVRVENSTFHIDPSGKRLREFIYSDENGSYVNRDLSVLSETILERIMDKTTDPWTGIGNADSVYTLKFKHLVWVPTLHTLFAVVAGDVGSHSKIVGFAYDRSANLRGWFFIDSPDYDALSICYANRTLYTLGQRVINGSKVLFLEKLAPFPDDNWDINQDSLNRIFMLDASMRDHVVSTDPAESVFTGFTHLANQEVSVIADGNYIGEFTVDGSGELDFSPEEYHDVQVGLKYDGYVKTLNLEAGATIGTAQPLLKRIIDIILHFYKSYGGKYGFRDDNMMDIEYPDYDGQLYTGDSEKLNFDSTSGETQHIIIKKDDPTPFYLLGISMIGDTEEQ